VALLVPQWADSAHLHLLAEVAQCFCDHHFRDRLHECEDAAAVCRLFNGRETLEQAARGDRRLVLAAGCQPAWPARASHSTTAPRLLSPPPPASRCNNARAAAATRRTA